MKNIWDRQDNGDLAAKLNLRRYFLSKYHATEPPAVFDACQGTRVIWSALEQEYKLASYWGVDQKKKKGRLKIDSTRVLSLPGWSFDVIDVDTYGVPWKHWLALLPRLRKPATVFLTLGRVGTSGIVLCREEHEALGTSNFRAKPPGNFLGVFGRMLGEAVTPIMLTHGNLNGRQIIEAKAAVSRTSNAQYFGLRILPAAS